MRRTKGVRTTRMSATFRSDAPRVIVLGGPQLARHSRPTMREAKLWVAAVRRSYVALLIGFFVAAVLVAILLLSD